MRLSGPVRSATLAMLLAFDGTPGAARAANPPAPADARVVLGNGMTVILAPDHEVPLVALELRYQAGSRDDPEGRAGLAWLVQHLMIRATAHVSDGEYDRALNAAGASDFHSSTGLDSTYFRVTVPTDQLPLPLWLWSDQMGFFAGRPDPRLIDQEIATLRNGYVRSVDNAPAGQVPTLASNVLYPPGHPYHGGVIRSPETLRGVTPGEVSAFAASRYTPDRATLVLAGDFDRGHALALIEKYFGTIPGRAAAPRRSAAPVGLTGETHLTVAAQVELPSVTITWATAPSRRTDDAELDVIAEIVAGGRRAGYLRRLLVSSLKVATSVSAQQTSRELGSEFVIKATAAPGVTGAALMTALDDALRRLPSVPLEPGWATAAVTDYLIDRTFALEGHMARATLYGRCDELGIAGDCVVGWTRTYTRLTPTQLAAAIARELPLGRRVVVEVVPTPGAPIAGVVQKSEVR